MHAIANKLPNAFNGVVKVTKLHISAINISARINVLKEHEELKNNVSRLKCGRPIGSKDVVPLKRRGKNHELLF